MTNFQCIVDTIPHGREIASSWLHQHGGIVLSPREGRRLETLFSDCSGVHVDIGTYFGGSAILAALTKPAGRVYTIDCRLGGHWTTKDITSDMVNENLEYFGVADKITQVVSCSNPWPLDVTPETVFIDGAEAEAGNDWKNTCGITTRYIIFHDCRRLYPSVVNAVRRARTDPRWKQIDSVDSIRIFERI